MTHLRQLFSSKGNNKSTSVFPRGGCKKGKMVVKIAPDPSIRKKTKIWKTKTGARIRICDMTDEHLLNTINFLEQIGEDNWNSELQKAKYLALGAVGIISFDQEVNEVLESSFLDYIPDIYWDMLEDAQRRGIKFGEIELE